MTKHFVAISNFEFEGKIRQMALAYDKKGDLVEIITVHPIKPYQKFSRIHFGRWKEI